MRTIPELIENSMHRKREKQSSPLIPILFGVILLVIIAISIFNMKPEDQKSGFFEIVFILLMAIVAHAFSVNINKPMVLVLIFVGILLSNSFLSTIWPYLPNLKMIPIDPPNVFPNMEVLQTFATFGLIILMLKVGLKEEIGHMFRKDDIPLIILDVAVPFAIGFLYAQYTGGSFLFSMFLATALTATSVGVTVSVLEEFKAIKLPFAETIMGVAVIDDIISLALLAIITSLAVGAESQTILNLGFLLIAGIFYLIAGAKLFGLIVENHIDKGGFDQETLLIVLASVFLYSYVAEFIGLSTILGAFFSGLLLTKSKYRHKILVFAKAIGALFVPIFFISLGLLIDVQAVLKFWEPVLILTFVAVGAKILGCGIGALLSRKSITESLAIGVGMAARGEVSLVVVLFGLNAGVLTSNDYSIISAVVIITILVVPLLLNRLVPKIISLDNLRKADQNKEKSNIRYLS